MLGKFWYGLGRLLFGIYARTMFRMDIDWKTPLPDGPFILAANHPCTVDPAMLTLLTHRQVSILILDTLFDVPLFGWSLRFSGHIRVAAGQGQAAIEEAQRRLKKGGIVAVFPEGQISPLEGGFHPPRTGAARLALACSVPVVPIGIHLDPRQIRLVETNVKNEPATGTWYMNGPYGITIGEPIIYHGQVEDRERVRQVADQVMRRIIQLSSQSAGRIRSTNRPYWLRPASSTAMWKIPLLFFRKALGSVRI